MSQPEVNADAVKAVIADVGQWAKAEIAASDDRVDPIGYLERKHGRIDAWPREVLVAFVAMELATTPEGQSLRKVRRDDLLPALRVAYRSIRDRE